MKGVEDRNAGNLLFVSTFIQPYREKVDINDEHRHFISTLSCCTGGNSGDKLRNMPFLIHLGIDKQSQNVCKFIYLPFISHNYLRRFSVAIQISGCFERGLDPLFVQDIMGHSNYSTTLGYTHLPDTRRKKELEKIERDFLDLEDV